MPSLGQTLSNLARLASAVDPSRGCSLDTATPRQLAEIDRALLELTSALTASHSEEALAALDRSPQARLALVQILSSAIRLVTPDISVGGDSGSTSSHQQHAKSGAGTGRSGGGGDASGGGCGVGAAGAAVGRPMGRWAQTQGRSAAALKMYVHNAVIGGGILTPAIGDTLLAAVRAGMLSALGRQMAASLQAGQPPPLTAPEHAVLASLMWCFLGHALMPSNTNLRQGYQQLLPALADSYLLEHWARDAAGGGGQGQQPNPFNVYDLLAAADLFTRVTRPLGDSPGTGPHVRRILHGPCLQYFVAAHVVSQLHAADGGPLYGMPREALLPPLPATTQEQNMGLFQRQGQDQGRGRQRRTDSSPLSSNGLSAALHYWKALAGPVHATPPKPIPRNLIKLCLRIARVALASMGDPGSSSNGSERGSGRGVAGEATAPDSGSASGGGGGSDGGGGGGGVALRRLLDVEPSSLPLDALLLASEMAQPGAGDSSGGDAGPSTSTVCAAVQGGGSSGGSSSTDPRLHDGAFARTWWPLAVAAVRSAMIHPAAKGSSWSDVERCFQLLDLSSPRALRGKAACMSPGLRHALAAGYIPCYEALMRRTLRMARDPSVDAQGVDLPACTWRPLPSLPLLLAYGDARQAASLAATLAKALLVIAGEPGTGAGGGGGGGGMGVASRGSSSSSSRGGRGSLPVAPQCTHAALAYACGVLAAMRESVRPVQHAGQLAAGSEGTPTGSGESRSIREVAGGQGQHRTPDSALRLGHFTELEHGSKPWRQMCGLFGCVTAKFMAVCVRLMSGLGVQEQFDHLQEVLLNLEFVLVLCEMNMESGDSRAGSWRQALVDMGCGTWLEQLLQDLGAAGDSEAPHVRYMAGVRGKLQACLGRQRQQRQRQEEEGVAPGDASGGGGDGSAVGALLPPCEAGEVLRTCCNLLCTNLAGDSEAALEAGLQQGGGRAGVGRVEGAAGWYCSWACAVAHQVVRRRQWGAAGEP